MRELTQTEIDNAPDWATHYFIFTDTAVYENETHFMASIEKLKLRNGGVGMRKDAKPIPRKEFDISEHEFDDEDVGEIEFNEEEVQLNMRDGSRPSILTKVDSIALAKHFKLTADDLK